ncbi:hypothetical protein FOH38_05395 [Lysinibacillus fusiformis]|nr:hypothetical protein FOH38_05395 [Lysinibacillus fusiformis]
MNMRVHMKMAASEQSADVLTFQGIANYMNAEEPSLLELILYYRSAIFHSLKGGCITITKKKCDRYYN